MLKIALTGNIASGKTTAEKFFTTFGLKVLCLDSVTAFIYLNNPDFKRELVSYFKTDKKEEISKIVFGCPDKLKFLEQMIYPYIKAEIEKFFIQNKNEKAVMVSGATIFEAGFEKYFDKIILVSSNEDLRIERLKKRNNLSYAEAKTRVDAQRSEEEKIKKSDYIIKNNGNLVDLKEECKRAIKSLSIPL